MIKGEFLQIYGGFTCQNPAIVIQNVIVGDLLGNAFPEPQDALIDTGADRTVVPIKICRNLRLRILGRPYVRGFDEQEQQCSIYWACLKIEGVGDIPLKVFGVNRRSILLGRDFLKSMLLVMDDRSSKFGISISKQWKTLLLKSLRTL